MALLNGLEKVVSSVVDALNQVGISLSIGSPHDDDLVKAVLGLKVTDVLADLLNVSPASLGALENVISTVLLIGGNEVWVVDGGKGNHLGHLLLDLGLEGRLEDLSAIHGLSQIHLANVPAANDKVVGVNHGEDVMEGNVDLLMGLGIMAKLEGRAHNDRAVVVGLARTLLGIPGELTAVGEDASGDGSAIVASEANQHHADLGDLTVDLEVIESLIWSGDILAISINVNLGSAVGVSGTNFRISVGDVGGVDGEEVLGS